MDAVLVHRFWTLEDSMFGVESGRFWQLKNRWTSTPDAGPRSPWPIEKGAAARKDCRPERELNARGLLLERRFGLERPQQPLGRLGKSLLVEVPGLVPDVLQVTCQERVQHGVHIA